MLSKFSLPITQLTMVVVLTAGLGACQTISDLDPTGLLSDNNTSTADNSAATPDLAGLPDAPPTTTPDDQKKVADSLSAAGAKTQYSADVLRAGTEAAAQAPGAAAPVTTAAADDLPPTADAGPPAADIPPSAQAAAPVAETSAVPTAPTTAPVQTAALAPASPAGEAAVPAVARAVTAPTAARVPVAPAAEAAVAAAPAAPVQMAALAPAPAPGSEPAVPAVPPLAAGSAGFAVVPTVSDTALGFKPSSAPPLDPSVSKFVSAPILSRYRQTASLAGTTGLGVPAVSAVPGGSGAVVANLDAVGTPSSAIAAMNGGVAPTAIVYFPGDGTGLSAAGRARVREAAAAFKANGGAGIIRVVGHASSRTADMPVEKHLEVIFDKSQKRANAVAQELIHEGVPADKVVIEAVGDSQPIYYESMPKGEDGNRRAEIFVQS